jgi:phi13 family phage major tail protein
MTTEDTPDAAPAYGAVVKAPGVMSLNINPNSSQETLFADDGPMETASTLGKIEVEIQKNQLTTADKAALLGHTIDSKGGLIYGDSDVPPWMAIGFRTLKSNGKYRYVWLYKGEFSEPEDSNETKGDSINFQADTISGQFTRLNFQYEIGDKKIRPWKYEMDEEHETADKSTIEGWFTKPVMPVAGT